MAVWLRQFCIHVSDIDATIRFYETLGLECTSRTVLSDDLTEAIIENPERGAWIQLAQDAQIAAPIEMGNAVRKLYVYTDDCQGVYDRALAAGYTSVSPPTKLDRWPTTIAFVADPDGYQVELVQRDEKPLERNPGGTPRDQAL